MFYIIISNFREILNIGNNDVMDFRTSTLWAIIFSYWPDLVFQVNNFNYCPVFQVNKPLPKTGRVVDGALLPSKKVG